MLVSTADGSLCALLHLLLASIISLPRQLKVHAACSKQAIHRKQTLALPSSGWPLRNWLTGVPGKPTARGYVWTLSRAAILDWPAVMLLRTHTRTWRRTGGSHRRSPWPR
ncbi:hypothetical protein J3F83DRAFT_106939 [Trichoderma novae-zelandiae]